MNEEEKLQHRKALFDQFINDPFSLEVGTPSEEEVKLAIEHAKKSMAKTLSELRMEHLSSTMMPKIEKFIREGLLANPEEAKKK